MKTWKEIFNMLLLASLLCTIVFFFSPGVSFGDHGNIAMVLSAIPYVLLFIMGIWVSRIFAKKDRKIEALENTHVTLSNLLSRQSVTPDIACIWMMDLIGNDGGRWWSNFGKDTLSKLFYERQSNEADKIDYIEHFLREAVLTKYQKNASIMLPTIFSELTSEDLAKVMANAYYFYAVNLLGGRVTASAENLTLAIKTNHSVQGIMGALLPDVNNYVKKIVAEHCTGNEEQKVLGIIEGEITKAWK